MTPAPGIRRKPLGKTTRPLLSDILPRARVFALLDEARDVPITWISGPPGSGKTTAVASWLDNAPVSSLWYQIDEGDADPATFFYYLGLAVADLERELGLPDGAVDVAQLIERGRQVTRRHTRREIRVSQHVTSQSQRFPVEVGGLRGLP